MQFTLAELAVKFGCELKGDPETVVNSIATLSSASAGDISFFTNKKYKQELINTKASVVILRHSDLQDCTVNALISVNPYASYARVAQLFYPIKRPAEGIHPSAVINNSKLPKMLSIGPNVVIEEGVVLGENVAIGANCYIGANTEIGAGTILDANVTIRHDIILGKNCYIHPGVVIGSDGFGQAPDVDGYVKIPQAGRVVIGNDVEIGANTTVDRGTLSDTIIEDGVKLDNLIQVAHNVVIGEHTVIAATCGISGSTKIGKRCMIGGRVGFVGHLEVCDDVIINSSTVVTSSITEKGHYGGTGGFPHQLAKDWTRNVAQFRRINNLAKRVKELEKK